MRARPAVSDDPDLRILCKHCRQRTGNYPRGLCKVCWEQPEIRTAYPTQGHGGYRHGRRMLTAILCRHCKDRQPNTTRGLCWPCFADVDIRRLYPLRGTPEEVPPPQTPPEEPTLAPPRTEEKIRVLAARFRKRLPLFHPRDNRRSAT